MRRAIALWALAAWSGLAPATALAGHSRIDAEVPVATGVTLDASLYLPDAPLPLAAGLPLIVRQHGGGSDKDSAYDLKYGLAAVETGRYALLTYSVRGHGNSGGIFDFFGPETVADFSRMLDWVAATSAARGLGIDTKNVGASGYSQGGGTSVLPAEHDPRVRAVAVGNTFDSLAHALDPNGCYKFSFATAIFTLAYKQTASRTDDASALRWGATLMTGTDGVGTPPLVPSTQQELAARSPLSYVDSLNVPVFWSNSWEDQLFPPDHPQSILERLHARGVPTHYWFASGGHEAGPNDPADEHGKEAAMLAWFDRYLRNDHSVRFRKRVDYAERLPGGGWTHKRAATWPIPNTRRLVLYPSSGGLLGEAPGPSGAPVGSIVNGLVNLDLKTDPIVVSRAPQVVAALPPGPDTGNGIDTAVYQSSAVTGPTEVVGAPKLHLRIASTAATQFQVSAKVYDIAPDGAATMIHRSCTVLPAHTTSAKLPLWPNAHVFPSGHRIALAIAAVDFPTFQAEPEPQQTTILGGTRLVLPTVAP